MNIGFIRSGILSISEDKQKEAIKSYCNDNDIVFINNLSSYIVSGNDLVFIYGLLVLGKNIEEVIFNISNITKHKGKIYVINIDTYISNDSLKDDISDLFLLFNKINKSLQSDLTIEALCRKKIEGKILGRPKGTIRNNSNLIKHIEDIEKALFIDYESVLSLAKRYQVVYGTMVYFIKNNFPLYKSKIALNKDKKDKY